MGLELNNVLKTIKTTYGCLVEPNLVLIHPRNGF